MFACEESPCDDHDFLTFSAVSTCHDDDHNPACNLRDTRTSTAAITPTTSCIQPSASGGPYRQLAKKIVDAATGTKMAK